MMLHACISVMDWCIPAQGNAETQSRLILCASLLPGPPVVQMIPSLVPA